jgi:excisionase family DNA binding protein
MNMCCEDPAPELVNSREAAQMLHVSKATIDRYAKSGVLRGYLLPKGERRFLRSDVQGLLTPEHPDPASNERGSQASQ